MEIVSKVPSTNQRIIQKILLIQGKQALCTMKIHSTLKNNIILREEKKKKDEGAARHK